APCCWHCPGASLVALEATTARCPAAASPLSSGDRPHDQYHGTARGLLRRTPNTRGPRSGPRPYGGRRAGLARRGPRGRLVGERRLDPAARAAARRATGGELGRVRPAGVAVPCCTPQRDEF